MVRSSMIDQLNESYVTTARAKGMSFPFILVRHTLRNALVPVVTLIGCKTMGHSLDTQSLLRQSLRGPGLACSRFRRSSIKSSFCSRRRYSRPQY